MKLLTIRWQRLVDDENQTCERCTSTETELQKAFVILKNSLELMGIKVVLEKNTIDSETFTENISESNRIWIGERPLEEWLGAEVGESECGSCCDIINDVVECRTVTVGSETYEEIPAELIVKAGLLAAAQLLGASSEESCCPSPVPTSGEKSGCCPAPTEIPDK
ncbi:DUF2703 domain-containing protein [bacterium]|nr:DUF2703 domain-containing protein [bacterium]